MKKIKFFLLIVSTVTMILLIYVTTISIFDFFAGDIRISVFISPVLTICNLFFTKYLSQTNEKNFIVKYQYDDFFTDRDNEYTKLMDFILNRDERMYYITGKNGIGKSLLLKESADRINSKKRKFKFAALYINLGNNHNIFNDIGDVLELKNPVSIDKICETLIKNWSKKWVLLVDEVDEVSFLSVKDFANAIYNRAGIKTIISYNGKLDYSSMEPTPFEEKDIRDLSDKYGLLVDESTIKKIKIVSKGLPVFVRFLLNQYKYFKRIDFTNNIDIQIYIGNIIKYNLSQSDKRVLSIICCLKSINKSYITIKDLSNIFSSITKDTVKKLFNLSLIDLFDNSIVTEDDIINICAMHLDEYKNESYTSIYRYYRHMGSQHDLALFSLLKTNLEIGETQWIYITIQSKLNTGDYSYIVKIGQLDREQEINPHIFDNLDLYQFIQIAYFNTLLSQGLYNEAERVIKTYDFSLKGRKGILNIQTSNDFDIHYSMADLYHLTNKFKDAIAYCELLLEKCHDKNNYNKIIYLEAHCIRHIGKDYLLAVNLFKQITENKRNIDISPKIYIRSMYSILSIQMLWGVDKNNLYTNFETLHKLANDYKINKSIDAFIDRHYLNYLVLYDRNVRKAIEIAEKTVMTLEKNNARIKYDYYFELGELYRLLYEKEKTLKLKQRSLYYYSLAIDFAQDSKDYNLESMCQLGIILITFGSGSNNDMNSIDKIIQEILMNTKNKELFLNYCYATFIKHFVHNQSINPEIISTFQQLYFNDLCKVSLLYNSNKPFYLKLVVM